MSHSRHSVALVRSRAERVLLVMREEDLSLENTLKHLEDSDFSFFLIVFRTTTTSEVPSTVVATGSYFF